MRIPTKKVNRIIQIDVTSVCDKTCGNCTRALAQIRKPDMTVEQFHQAVLASYEWVIRENGVLSIFGGNPCAAKDFLEYCRILAEYLPVKNRGLWTNNLLGKGYETSRYFDRESTFNFNVHQDQKAAAEIKTSFPWAKVYGIDKPSIHSSILLAARDFIDDEAEIFRRVENCSYDIHWSAIVVQEAPDWTQLGGYSCEIASTHARLNGQPLGVKVEPGWLDHAIDRFEPQYRFACPRCSGCLGVSGVVDLGPGSRDQVSATNQHLVQLTWSPKRQVEVLDTLQGQGVVPVNYLRDK